MANDLVANTARATRPPNIVLILTDDQGYQDLGCFGSSRVKTPRIDSLARTGMKFTHFYAAAPRCTPSRAALLTGCYPRRVSMHVAFDNKAGILRPVSSQGLHPDEITLAEILREQGYATACIGKWHLGDQPEFLPTRQGFDLFFGLPYSNTSRPDWPPLPLLYNETPVEVPVIQETLTKRYTERAVRFMRQHQDQPFFLYLPHTFPHRPFHASPEFQSDPRGATYADTIREIDWSTGVILGTLADLGLEQETLVIFLSDNGGDPRYGACNLPLRGGKHETLEGGMRVPCLLRWPGRIPAGAECAELATIMDLYPTIAHLTGAKVPDDRVLDGRDISALLLGEEGARTPHEAFFYFSQGFLRAVRSGPFKLELQGARLYDLRDDPSEALNIAAHHPETVQKLLALAQACREDLGDGKQQTANQRPAGFVAEPRPLVER